MTIAAPKSFDLIAIGSGPAGEQAAVQAAALGKRAAVVERGEALGGASTNTGTVPSKTLRAAILELTGGAGGVYSGSFAARHELTIDDLLWRTSEVIEHERDAVSRRLRRCGVTVIDGTASFVDPHTLSIASNRLTRLVRADSIVIAVGTAPARPAGIEFDERTILDSDGILGLERLPRSLTVIGGGVIGLEYASMAAALGIHATLVERRQRILDYVDDELVETLQYHLRGHGLALRLGEEAVAVAPSPLGGAVTTLAGGEKVASDAVLHAAGRRGATDSLELAAAGLTADRRGRITVDAEFRTVQPHIFAAGDVVGFPNLAATAMEQGRLAALAALGADANRAQRLLPYGIYTIPEISFIGPTEQQLAASGADYVTGRAHYRDLSRGEIAGDRSGLLKLLVDAPSRRILGVHIFGTSAAELVHLGQALMAGSLTVDHLVDTVFNVPTFSDAYKLAAFDAVARLDGDARAA